MITQELLGYMRAEVAKGKAREEIHQSLISGGGWSEDDLSEAFRTIIPMQNIVLPKEKPIEPVSLMQGGIGIPTLKNFGATSPTPLTPITSPTTPLYSPPLRSFSTPSSYSPSPSILKPTPLSKPSTTHSSSSLLKFLIILIIIGGLGFGFWHYRSQIMSLWDSLVNKTLNSYTPSVGTDNTTNSTQNNNSNNQATAPNPIIPPVAQVKDCGTTTAPKLDTPATYENNPVLSCLGASALNCENARGILKDDFFPTIFEIIQPTQTQGSCSFKLSYAVDSTLTDATGRQLAGQYVSCPTNIVKVISNTKATILKFVAPNTTDLGKYASQIYFYGTLGLFLENNLDQNKIYALGCGGEYIQSMIASYNAKKP